MSELPNVPRDKYADDPLVPISGKRLSAALELRGISVNQAGQHPGLKQQTVSYIVNGRTRRCRRSRRKRLADLLEISDAWLAGENEPPIGGLPVGISSPPENQDRPDRVDENIQRFAVESEELPAAYHLYWSKLTEQILAAWKRDIEAGVDGAAELRDVFPGDFTGEPWPRVSLLIHRALGITWWRQRLLVRRATAVKGPSNVRELTPGEHSELAEANQREHDAENPAAAASYSPEAADDFAKAGVTAVETMLQPWFDGAKALDYRAVTVALGWLRGGMLMGGLRVSG